MAHLRGAMAPGPKDGPVPPHQDALHIVQGGDDNLPARASPPKGDRVGPGSGERVRYLREGLPRPRLRYRSGDTQRSGESAREVLN